MLQVNSIISQILHYVSIFKSCDMLDIYLSSVSPSADKRFSVLFLLHYYGKYPNYHQVICGFIEDIVLGGHFVHGNVR